MDRERIAVETVRNNLEHTGLAGSAELQQADAFRMLSSWKPRPFDYVYIAPPQFKGLWIQALELLDRHPGWLSADAWVIVQIHPNEYEMQKLSNLVEFDQRRYGSTQLVFYIIE